MSAKVTCTSSHANASTYSRSSASCSRWSSSCSVNVTCCTVIDLHLLRRHQPHQPPVPTCRHQRNAVDVQNLPSHKTQVLTVRKMFLFHDRNKKCFDCDQSSLLYFYPRTKYVVDRMNRCGDMAIQNFPTWRPSWICSKPFDLLTLKALP